MECLARRGAAPLQNKAHSNAKRPAAAALFDDHEPQCPPVEKTSLLCSLDLDEDPVPVVPPSTCPASKKIRTERHRLPESDEDLEYRALSPSTPPVKKTQPHSQTAKRPRPALVEDDEEPAQLSSPPPAKKIRSDSPLPPLTEDEDDEPSPPPPPKPMKQAKKVAPRLVVPSSPQPAATKLSLKIKLTPANPPSIEDEDITPDAPVASKKKGRRPLLPKLPNETLLATRNGRTASSCPSVFVDSLSNLLSSFAHLLCSIIFLALIV
ncbi:hypothetical protein EV424DRAFT_1545453 [Suillus variegatus]|nr:hypothetical protein EV424DRAFT_1545453 [Suillus variegatus]